MKFFFRSAALLSALVSFATVSADSFEETALKILQEGPEYRLEELSLKKTRANLNTESNLPDPEISGEYLVMPHDNDNRWAAQLEWGVEWPGVYNARAKEADSRFSEADWEITAQRAQRLAEIKDLLLDYIRSRQKLKLLDELAQNNDTIYKLAEEAARGGELTLLDLNKIRLEYANIRIARATLLDEQNETVTNISQIYGSDCNPLLQQLSPEFPVYMMPSQDELTRIKDSAPAVRAALAQAETARKSKKVSKMEALPSLSLGYKHAFEDGIHFNGAVFGVSIPMFSSRGKQKAADADIREAEFKAEATAQEIENEVAATIRRLEIVNEQINEIAPIVENADYNNALLKAYKAGLITLIEYISDRNYFTNAAVELVALRHNAAKAMAFLQRYLQNPALSD